MRVGKGSTRAPENGTGFVVSVDAGALSVLTARHLFYDGKDRFTDDISVTFYSDQLNSYKAELKKDSPNLDLAVLKIVKVPESVSQQLPTFSVRSDSAPLSIGDALYAFGGESQSWQVPLVTVSGSTDGDRPDRFRFTGIGIRAGFSGAPMLDNSGRLAAVHLGTVEADESFGHAQRMTYAYGILKDDLGVKMNKLDLGGAMVPANHSNPPMRRPEVELPARQNPQSSDPKAGPVSAALSQPGTMERVAARLGLRSDLKIQNASETLRWYQSAKALATNPAAFNQIAGHESPMLVGKITSVAGQRIRASEVMLRYLTPVLYFDLELSIFQLDFEPRPGMYVAFRGTPVSYSIPNVSSVECRLSVLPAHFLEIEPTF